jgi:hypothetical protein
MTESAPAVTHPQLPVDNLNAALPELRRPFTANAVHWKIQASFPKNDPKKSLIVPYIDMRLVVARLSLVCGREWSEGRPAEVVDGVLIPEVPAFQQLPSGALRCALTAFGVTHYDVGEAGGGFSKEKSLHSDALKRTGVKFEVGSSLYAIPKQTFALPESDQEPGWVRREKGSKWNAKKGAREEVWSMLLTDVGLKELHDRYSAWLDSDENNFGSALDHGDVAGAIGDIDDAVNELEGDGTEAAPELSSQTAEGQQALAASVRKGGNK